MLIIVTSLFFVFTITQVNTLRRQAEIGSLSNQFYHLNEARNAANAGVEMVLADMKANNLDPATNVSASQESKTYTFGNKSADVVVIRSIPTRVLEDIGPFNLDKFQYGVKTSFSITSTGLSNQKSAKVRVQTVAYQGMPKIDGALSLLGEGSKLTLTGNAGTICGYDMSSKPLNWTSKDFSKQKCEAQNDPDDINKPGISTNFPETPDTFDEKGFDVDDPNRVDGNPSRKYEPNSDTNFWLEFARFLAQNPDITCTVSGCSPNVSTTPNTITLVKEGGRLAPNGNSIYNGIILIESGGTLDLNGNITVNALVLILGSDANFKLTGTPVIRGGVILVNSGSNLKVDEFDLIDPFTGEIATKGDFKIFYDSSIVKEIVTGHPKLTPPRFYTEFFID
jgi:hypothetical protein